MQVSLFSVLNERSWLSDKEACLDLVLIQVLQKREALQLNSNTLIKSFSY